MATRDATDDAGAPQPLFLPGVPGDAILARYARAPGQEQHRLASPQSSAFLAANAFGFFLGRLDLLPPLPGLEALDWPARSIALEEEMRFPWAGGRHPWLDVVLATAGHLIGIESKRFEPFRPHAPGSFSAAFVREGTWSPGMRPFQAMLDGACAGFRHLDATQLVKHALGLHTQAGKRGVHPVLLYLYAEPQVFPSRDGTRPGRLIAEAERRDHAAEVARFAEAVKGAEVRFMACTYDRLLGCWAGSDSALARDHAAGMRARFSI